MWTVKRVGNFVVTGLAIWGSLAQIAPQYFTVPEGALGGRDVGRMVWLIPPLAIGWILYLLYLIDKRLDRIDPPLDEKHVESTVRGWAHDFGWSVRQLRDPLVHFALEVQMDGGLGLVVGREKASERYITASVTVLLRDDHKELLAKLSEPYGAKMANALQLALIDRGVEYKNAIFPFNDGIALWRRTLISGLNETTFLETINQVCRAQAAIAVTIESYRPRPLGLSI
jgi:hypothetical protein